MAHAYIDVARGGDSRLGVWLRELRTTLSQRAARRAAYRRTLDELIGLSDKDLADLGIARANIRRIAREAAELA